MDFASTQRRFADHVRDPERNPAPANLEERRLQIYRELVFNNIEGFLSSGFPVLRSLYDEGDWLDLVRTFLAQHRAHSPYFLKISEEFLQFLQEQYQMRPCDPPFMRELAHYEWVELALDVAVEQVPPAEEGELTPDLLAGQPRVSPLVWLLSYEYPVHRLGPDYRPASPPGEPTFLIVYRDRRDAVQFMQSNAVTLHLLQLLRANPELTGEQALRRLAVELCHPDPHQLLLHGDQLLRQLQRSNIVL